MASNNSNWNRLESVIRWANMSTNYFARHIGLSRAENLYQIKSGNNGISYNLAQRIVECFPEISIGWLLTGEGDMFGRRDNSRMIPFYESIEEMCSREAAPAMMLNFPLFTRCDYAYRSNDVSMSGEITSGAVVFVEQIDAESLISGALYVVESPTFVLLRRVRLCESGELRLETTDTNYDPINISTASVKSLYRVVGAMKMY
ncbi:MAG: LexA family transcriptional regulator [Alistipes sp.]|nr:LexA family transcriptional regulator [Alistipes sp.]